MKYFRLTEREKEKLTIAQKALIYMVENHEAFPREKIVGEGMFFKILSL